MDSRYPVALLLLALTPLVLLLRRRRPIVRIPVANLYLWKEAATAATPALSRHLRRHWLALLQTACLALIAVAAAGVQLDDDSAPVALILDASITMGTDRGGVTRFDLAVAEIKRLADRMPDRARVRLIVADPHARVVGEFSSSDRALGQTLDDLRVTDAVADLGRALEYARSASVPASRFFVFSDTSPPGDPSDSEVEWFSVGTPADNAAISGISWRRPTAQHGEIEVLVRIANQGVSALNAGLTLSFGVEPAGRQQVTVPPRVEREYSFVLTDHEGVATARLEHDDGLPADDTRSVVVPPHTPMRVLLTGATGYFLEKSLAADPDVRLVASTDDDPDIIVCDQCPGVPAGTAGVLLLPPPSSRTAEPVAVVKSAIHHPVTDGVDIDGTLAIISGGGPLEGDVLAIAGGAPAIVARDTGSRRILDVRLGTSEGPFPLTTAFPLVVWNGIRWLSHRDENQTTLNAGEPLQWRESADAQAPIVTGPDDRLVPARFINGVLSVADTGTAGIYRIRSDSADQAIAINPAIRSRSAPTSDVLRGGGGANRSTRSDAATNLTATLAVVALLLLALEWRYGVAAGTRAM